MKPENMGCFQVTFPYFCYFLNMFNRREKQQNSRTQTLITNECLSYPLSAGYLLCLSQVIRDWNLNCWTRLLSPHVAQAPWKVTLRNCVNRRVKVWQCTIVNNSANILYLCEKWMNEWMKFIVHSPERLWVIQKKCLNLWCIIRS